MEVILLERVSGLGDIGSVIKVKDGFAKNYLIPRKKVLRATDTNKKLLECKKAELQKINEEKKAIAQSHAVNIDGFVVDIIRQAGEDGKLYGSVCSRDVAKSLSIKSNVSIAHEMIMMHEKIKEVGIHEVYVALHPDVLITVKVNVARTEQEALAAIQASAADSEKPDVAKE